MLKSVSYGPANGKIYDSSSSFFGLPLAQFSPEDDQLPTPVEDMLSELFRRGPSTDGIFRKSALMKTVKQIRQDLEDGKSVNFEDKSVIVIATIFKEFLRGLPSCAFGSEFLSELLETNDITDSTERVGEIDKIFNRLPNLNQMLVKKFLCVLYHIARLSETNKMTSQNLAICIAPSFVWSNKAIVPACAKETTAACEFVQFLIDNFIEIFGEEATRILGDESEIRPPVTYDDDDDIADRSQDTVDNQTGCKSPEEPRAINPEFTLSLNVPDNRVTPGLRQRSYETEGNSNTTPRIPNRRRFYDFRIPSRRHSENDLTDLNDNLPARKLLPKVPLTSYTTTAELIKHNVNGGEGGSEPSSSVIRIVSSTKETLPVDNGRRKNSPSNHAVYHRKVRPTPSYEEAVRKLRRNAQLSPVSSQKPDERLGSSDESIDQKYEDKSQDIPLQFNTKKTSLDNEEPASPIEDCSPKGTESERQTLTYSILSPTPDRLKSCRYVSDELCRSPGNLSPNSGSSRQPKAPAYEQHLERRKRFEAAYLQKINLDLNDVNRRRELPNTTEYHSGGIDLTLSYNGTECDKTSFAGGKGLGTSLDSAGIRALGLRSRASRHDSIPLSNGIHTFITQRRSPNFSGNSKSRTSKHDNCSSQSPASSSMQLSPRLIVPQSGERDHKPASPLRAAIDLGSFMYRPSDTSQGDFSSTVEGRQENGFVVSHMNGVCSLETENNNNEFKCDGTLNSQSLKLGDKIVEDLDELISSLKNGTDGSDSSSSAESVGNLDVPSHEDIQTILCQDESYV